MTLRPDLSSCSYTTRWQDRHKTEPSKQLFDLYFMPNTPTAQASMLLGLSWFVLLLLDSEARVRQLQIAAEEKNNADRLRTLTKLLFFLSLTSSPTQKETDRLPSIWSSSPLLFPTSTFSTSLLTGSSSSSSHPLLFSFFFVSIN
jgi:hypothetical protein